MPTKVDLNVELAVTANPQSTLDKELLSDKLVLQSHTQ